MANSVTQSASKSLPRVESSGILTAEVGNSESASTLEKPYLSQVYTMSDQKQDPSQAAQPQKKKVNIHMPKDLAPVYANVAFISHSLAELVIDFAQVLPRSPRGSVQARVVMSPMHAKMLQMALAQNLAKYESQFGEIRLPHRGSALANNFFRFPSEGSDDADDDDNDE